MKIQRREAQTTSSPYFSVKSVARVTITIKNEVDANVPRGTVGVRRTKSSRLQSNSLVLTRATGFAEKQDYKVPKVEFLG